MAANDDETRERANEVLKNAFEQPEGCNWAPEDAKEGPAEACQDLDMMPFAVVNTLQGEMTAACLFNIYDGDDLEDDVDSWGEIKLLGTDPAFKKKGYGCAAAAAALTYFQHHTEDVTFGCYADTYVDCDGFSAVKLWESIRMKHDESRPDQVDTNGARSMWMAGNIAECLEACETKMKQKGTLENSESCIIDAGSFDKIRCKITRGERLFELHYTYKKYNWTGGLLLDEVPTLNGSGDIDWKKAEPVLKV